MLIQARFVHQNNNNDTRSSLALIIQSIARRELTKFLCFIFISLSSSVFNYTWDWSVFYLKINKKNILHAFSFFVGLIFLCCDYECELAWKFLIKSQGRRWIASEMSEIGDSRRQRISLLVIYESKLKKWDEWVGKAEIKSEFKSVVSAANKISRNTLRK